MPLYLMLIVAALLLPTLVGCSSSPTRLYVLSADAEKSAAAPGQSISIGIGPITLPKYLDRPQMVTRVASNGLNQGDFDQWGGDLNDNITRVLAINLANLLGTDRVSLYPWKDPTVVGYQVTLDMTRFEQGPDGNATLDAFWSLIDPSSGKTLLMRRSTYQENGPPAASGPAETHAAAAAAMSRDLESLSRDIAAAIRQQRHF